MCTCGGWAWSDISDSSSGCNRCGAAYPSETAWPKKKAAVAAQPKAAVAPHPRLHDLTDAHRVLLDIVGDQLKAALGFNIFEHLAAPADAAPQAGQDPSEEEALRAITSANKALHQAEAACDAKRRQLQKAVQHAREVGARVGQAHELVRDAISKQDAAKRVYDKLYGPGAAATAATQPATQPDDPFFAGIPDPRATPQPGGAPTLQPPPLPDDDMIDKGKRDRETDKKAADELSRLDGIAQGGQGGGPPKKPFTPSQPTPDEQARAAAAAAEGVAIAQQALAAATAAAGVACP